MNIFSLKMVDVSWWKFFQKMRLRVVKEAFITATCRTTVPHQMQWLVDSEDVHPLRVFSFLLIIQMLRVSCFGGFFWLLWCSLVLVCTFNWALAHSFFMQWNDSIDNSPQERLPRRKKRKWTSLEEETLRAGVKMYVSFLQNQQNHKLPRELSWMQVIHEMES